MARQTRLYRYDFRGHVLIPVAADGAGGPFVKIDTSSAGSPTVQGIAGGGVRSLLDSTSEVQNLCVSMNDILAFDIENLVSVEFIAKTNVAAIDSTTSLAFGVGSARNDVLDSVAEHAWFRMEGGDSTTAVVVETDDGTNDNNDVATGLVLNSATVWKRFKITFKEATNTVLPPSTPSKNSDVRFYGGNANGSLRRVASGTRFDMSNYTGNLQLLWQIQKTADTNVDGLDILEACVEMQLPDYS